MRPDGHGVYVHIPWCRRRCPYCAFYVEADHDVPWERFAEALRREHQWREAAFAGPARTLYLGGGTPSRMPLPALTRLVSALGEHAEEITTEANPEDIDAAWLRGARDAGITRISLGIQTFNPRYARLLNRNSTVQRARSIALEVGVAGFASWSVDVMFALPGQTLEDLELDLEAILETEPPHVALYGLTYEPGTPFARARDQGSLVPVVDEQWRQMYDLSLDRLRAGGFERYEVSNFAQPGHRSQHNTGYWTHRPYLGLGPSAHGLQPDGVRYINDADAAAYMTAEAVPHQAETPDPPTEAWDRLAGGLRCSEGLDLDEAAAGTGYTVSATALAMLVDAGLIVAEGSRLRLTDDGYPIADAVLARLADLRAATPNSSSHAPPPRQPQRDGDADGVTESVPGTPESPVS